MLGAADGRSRWARRAAADHDMHRLLGFAAPLPALMLSSERIFGAIYLMRPIYGRSRGKQAAAD